MEDLNRQTRALAHHQRLETLGTLTSSIAHEFNNLLTPIMGYSLMALEKLPPEEEELYDNILEVYNASRTAKTLIARLSDLSRKNTDATFRPASPDELVHRAVEVAMPAKPANVEIRLDLSCQDQRFRVNEIQIQQLLLNLILNAFQAMEPDGGVLTVKTSFDDRNVFLRVKDNGCGISEEIRSRIFDPFFTTKESGRGTGLGLAIATQVAEDHRGSIHVESRLGEGTAFTVRLPRDR
jgi:signal transduction histidine kinase